VTHRRGARLAAPAALALGVLVTGCGAGGSTGDQGGPGPRITAGDFAFDPATLTVRAGEWVTVTMVNAGRVEHSFTADVIHTSVAADPGESTTASFTAPDSGTIAFHCKYHPTRMTGTITVSPASGGTSPAGGAPGS
jgi:plastocyanin